MNAKQAYNTSFENENIVNYVEKEISEEVEKSAKAGNYYAKVYVHFPDYIDWYKIPSFSRKSLGCNKRTWIHSNQSGWNM